VCELSSRRVDFCVGELTKAKMGTDEGGKRTEEGMEGMRKKLNEILVTADLKLI